MKEEGRRNERRMKKKQKKNQVEIKHGMIVDRTLEMEVKTKIIKKKGKNNEKTN